MIVSSCSTMLTAKAVALFVMLAKTAPQRLQYFAKRHCVPTPWIPAGTLHCDMGMAIAVVLPPKMRLQNMLCYVGTSQPVY